MSNTTLSQGTPKHFFNEIKPPEEYGLPVGYRQQVANFTLDTARGPESYWNDWRMSENAKYQHYVYRWAAKLIQQSRALRVLDVGCGPAVKLQRFIVPALQATTQLLENAGANPLLCGIDQASATQVAQTNCPAGTFVTVDLESPNISLDNQFDFIICADVIEHLVNPDPVLSLMRQSLAPGGRILLSTPDRERERGRDCMESNKPEHVREWSRPEFVSFLFSRDFHCHTTRRFPKADLPIGPMRVVEREYQKQLSPRSPLCCQAVLCS